MASILKFYLFTKICASFLRSSLSLTSIYAEVYYPKSIVMTNKVSFYSFNKL